jgi:hypothetical protein
MRKSQWDRIRDLYESGLSTIEVGRIVGLTRQGVAYALRQMGITLRPRGGNKRRRR